MFLKELVRNKFNLQSEILLRRLQILNLKKEPILVSEENLCESYCGTPGLLDASLFAKKYVLHRSTPVQVPAREGTGR
jgi:hypothetical protein